MLTFPSNSLPHLVLPMDGDAMIPHPFCSAPPHTEPPPPPPPPLLPLPSTTPRESDGTSGHRGPDRIQAVKPQGAGVEDKVETASAYNPSSFNRQSTNMVQVSQSKQPRVESVSEDDKHKQDGCDFKNAAEFQNTEKDFAEEHDKHLLERLDPTPASEALRRIADESASTPAGWLMGPLFQSFKSKMASFTEIVMSPTKLFKDKNLPAPELQPDENDESSGANRESRENCRQEENENSFTLLPQPGCDSIHSRRLFSTSLDGIEFHLPSSQEVPLLEEPTVKLADVIEDAKTSARQKTRLRKPAVEKITTMYSCNVQLERLHDARPNHIDGACRETNSDFVQSKRMLNTQVREERKRLKLDNKRNVAKQPPLKQKVPSAVSDGQEALKPAAKFCKVKRKVEGDEKNDSGRKAKHTTGDLCRNRTAPSVPVLPLGSANVKARKRKSVVPTQPASSAHQSAPAEMAAQSEGAPNPGRGRPIKRLKKAPRGEVQAQTKKTEAKCGKAQLSAEPLYFEMTPFEGNQSECTEPNQNGVSDGSASRLRNGRVNRKQHRGDSQVRRSRFGRTHADDRTASATTEDLPSRSVQSASAGRLLRSYSCPEIPSLFASLPRQPPLASVPSRVHGGSRRTRRHTVGGSEIEREIAPLCLRKEVYPSRRSFLCDGQNLPPALSPGSSLSALASCFLSSPLAFLSGRGAAPASHTVSSHAAPSSSSSLPILMKTDTSCGTRDACTSAILLAGETDGIAPSEEEDEDAGSSSHEFDEAAAALREEKSLSDSELKTAQKHEQRGKVSSIRIRRALPKPQNNLTPMGLPKAVRLKKKQFSLEEIYTNKNFCKPPESRLETVFEVPLSRRDGSESRFGQRRLKRFLEFLEVGEARKPKKVLGGGGGKSGATSSRTRRGGFAKDDAVASLLPPPDPDSLLCAKLKQLDLWLIRDQVDSAC